MIQPHMRRPSTVALRLLYRRLYRAFGPQHWWPAQTPFEMMVGAILTQATSWHNVEQAITRLRRGGALSARGLLARPTRELERAVRPAGYFRQKARYLQGFTRWYVARHQGSARRMFKTPWAALRAELLSLKGIGPETADSILLYAGHRAVFVVDAYTRRVFRRHRLIGASATYEEIQGVAMGRAPKPAQRYNEFHALLVAVGKRFCHRRHPECTRCPLGDLPRTLEETANGNR